MKLAKEFDSYLNLCGEETDDENESQSEEEGE